MTKRRSSGVRRRAKPSEIVVDEVAQASRDYSRSLPGKMRALAASVRRAREGDEQHLVVARSLAHRLSGTAGCYGFSELGALAFAIEARLWPAFSATGTEAVCAWSEIDRMISELDALVVLRTG